jgi:hypothetical protein
MLLRSIKKEDAIELMINIETDRRYVETMVLFRRYYFKPTQLLSIIITALKSNTSLDAIRGALRVLNIWCERKPNDLKMSDPLMFELFDILRLSPISFNEFPALCDLRDKKCLMWEIPTPSSLLLTLSFFLPDASNIKALAKTASTILCIKYTGIIASHLFHFSLQLQRLIPNEEIGDYPLLLKNEVMGPALKLFCSMLDDLNRWVGIHVLALPTPAERAKRIEFFVALSDELIAKQNYHMAMGMINGLLTAPLSRFVFILSFCSFLFVCLFELGRVGMGGREKEEKEERGEKEKK